MKIYNIPLIDYLAHSLDCMYISDLRFLDKKSRLRLRIILECISPDDFPPHDWEEALKYLLDQCCYIGNPANIRLALLYAYA